MGIQSEPVILVSSPNLAPVIAVVNNSISADITAPAGLISPSIRLRTGAAMCQIPNKTEEKMSAFINEYFFSASLMNKPLKTPSSITTLMMFPIMQKAKNINPV